MSRRDQIAMPPAEVADFLEEQRVVICASNGVRGWPHLMPLWYLMRGEELWAWTYARPVGELGGELLARYGGVGQTPEAREAIRAQAAKRVALQFRPERTASWDHRKLDELY